jgi:CubicO group peptidase (beta-lactamase class C family)
MKVSLFPSLVLATLALAMAPRGATAAADPAGGALTASEEAVYADRLVRNKVPGADPYDSMDAVPGAAHVRALPVAAPPTLPADVLAKAKAYALANNSKAMLIWRNGKLEEAVYGPGVDAATLLNAKSMGKPLGAIAVGRAIKLGYIKSLDQSAADFIAEWRGTPKAAITLRQLLSMTAGLAEQGAVTDPASYMTRAYLSPRHDDVLIHDYPLTSPPGTRYQYGNASAELIALIIERATKQRYATFVSQQILKPLGAAGGEVWIDRPGGLAHSGCCMLLPGETWMRLGVFLMHDGVWEGRRLLPEGYVEAMKTPTAQNPRYGLAIWTQGEYIPRRGFGRPGQMLGAVLHSEPYLAKDLFLFDGNTNQVLYMIPSQNLAILRMGDAPPRSPEWDNSYLPNLVLRAIGQP